VFILKHSSCFRPYIELKEYGVSANVRRKYKRNKLHKEFDNMYRSDIADNNELFLIGELLCHSAYLGNPPFIRFLNNTFLVLLVDFLSR